MASSHANPAYSLAHFNVTFPASYPFVAHVEIDRPEKMNAFFRDMWVNLGAIMRALSVDPDVRAVVLSGAGEKAFTAGLDVQAASENEVLSGKEGADSARRAMRFIRHVEEFQGGISALERCEKPVISVLHGYSLGLAIDMSLATDVRICTTDVKLSVKEVDIGLAADIGTLSRLPKAVGSMSWVKDVCLTGRTFDAQEALRVGLVSQVCATKKDAVDTALDWARRVAEKSPIAIVGTKELINYSRDHSVADGLRYTAVWNAAMTQTRDFKDAIQSVLQKRKPTFEKL